MPTRVSCGRSLSAAVLRPVAALALAAGVAAPALAQGYHLQLLARKGDTIGGKVIAQIGGVDLSDNGLVAFAGRSGEGKSTVWSPTAVLATEGELFGGVTLPNFNWSTIQINNSGEIAVAAPFTAPEGIFTSVEGKVGGAGVVIDGNVLTDTVGGSIFLANDGTVYFFAQIDDGRQGVFTQTSLLVADGDIIDSTPITLANGNTNDSIDVDANGVPYLFYEPAGQPRGVFTPNGFVVRDGDSYGADTLVNINTSDLAVSDSGLVAVCDNAEPNPMFVTGVAGAVTDNNTVIDGEMRGFAFDMDVNSAGTIAFRSESGAVFTQYESVFSFGDVVNGMRLMEVKYSTITINDLGQIACVATFEFGPGLGLDAVILATPICAADLDGNGVLNLDDVNLFASAFTGGDLLADLDGNGTLNLDDINTFAGAFVAGCP